MAVISVLLAPTIATRTPLRDYLLARLLPPEAGAMSIASARLGWFTPLKVERLEINDQEGRPLAAVAQVVGNRSLCQLLRNQSDLGKLTITEPSVHLALRESGSNLEDTIASWLKGDSETSTSPAVALAVEIHRGAVRAEEQHTGAVWHVEKINGALNLSSQAEQPWRVRVDGQLDGQPFAVDLAAAIGTATAQWPLGTAGNFSLQTESLSLQPARYIARRLGQEIDIAGALTSDVRGVWRPDQDTDPYPEFEVTLLAEASGIGITAPQLLGSDSLDLATARLESQLHQASGVVRLRSFQLDSNLGNASLATDVPLADLRNLELTAMVRALRRRQLRSAGELDLASAARALPGLLHIREDIQITRGQLAWNLSAEQARDGSTRWTGWLRSADLQASRAGQPIRWQFPLELKLAAIDGEEVALEQLSVESEFARLVGQGRLRDGEVRWQADLQQLARQLGEVVDLQGLTFQGDLDGALRWQEAATNRLTAEATLKLKHFELGRGGDVAWQERDLGITSTAMGRLDGRQLASLESAQLELVSGGDHLQLQLTEPVLRPTTNSRWPVLCKLQGNLANWAARAAPVVQLDGWRIDGRILAQAQSIVSSQRTEVQSLDGEIRDLTVDAEGVQINEPTVRLTGQMVVDHTTGACQIPQASLASGSVSAAAQRLVLQTDDGLSVAGEIAYRADISRLMRQLPSLAASAQTELSGLATGQVHLEAGRGITRFQSRGDIENLRAQRGRGGVAFRQASYATDSTWHEPQLSVKLDGVYNAAQDKFALDRAEITGASVQLAARGAASQVTTNPDVHLEGQVGYDLESLLTPWSSVLGNQVTLRGRHQQPFAMRGPLFPNASAGQPTDRVSPQLAAQFGLAWDRAEFYAVQVGPAQLDVILSDGLVRAGPLDVEVGEGQVHLAPTLHLNSTPLWMTLPPGPVAEQVRITPEMCKTWMRFVAPLLADATAAQGTFSVSLAKAEVPLLQSADGSMEGELAIHGATLGPGPLAQQFLGIAQQVKQLVGKGNSRITDSAKSWVVLQPQQIRFQLSDRRVYHEGFQMLIDDVPIRTRGSVGLDETLSMVAEVPIMDRWIAGETALAGLRGQILSVPVGGTVSRPRLDQRAITQLSGQLVRRAAEGYLQQEVGNQIQKQLDKLFK